MIYSIIVTCISVILISYLIALNVKARKQIKLTNFKYKVLLDSFDSYISDSYKTK